MDPSPLYLHATTVRLGEKLQCELILPPETAGLDRVQRITARAVVHVEYTVVSEDEGRITRTDFVTFRLIRGLRTLTKIVASRLVPLAERYPLGATARLRVFLWLTEPFVLRGELLEEKA